MTKPPRTPEEVKEYWARHPLFERVSSSQPKHGPNPDAISPTPSADTVVDEHGSLWSLVRNILTQGHSQQQDYAAGKYANYEEFSARVDAAARERTPEILAALKAVGL